MSGRTRQRGRRASKRRKDAKGQGKGTTVTRRDDNSAAHADNVGRQRRGDRPVRTPAILMALPKGVLG